MTTAHLHPGNETPSGWLIVRPLCPKTQANMMGLPILKLSTDVLRHHPLPGSHILVVENEQTGFALPECDDTVAVAGGGRNVSWVDADWLETKTVAY
nr:Wadjet anti-phage system protein JetD domain-containing protein [Endozoicomonas sp. SESOKO2]